MIKHLLFISSWLIVLNAQVDCQVYIEKFGTINGTQATILSFTGESIIQDNSSVQIKLRYNDPGFNDPTYYGLIQEEGKQQIDTCLQYKLWKYTSNSYADPIEITDLTLQGDSNISQKWRYLTFSILSTEFDNRLVKTENSNNYVYFGYYAIAFYNQGETTILYNYYFQFSITVNKETHKLIDTIFIPLNQIETKGCLANSPCNINPSTEFKWCTDFLCRKFYIPDINWKKIYTLQQKISIEGMADQYYLTNSTIYLLGNGMSETIVPLQFDNSVKGQINIQFLITKAWLDAQIYVVSYLTDGISNVYDPMSGWTILYHIKFSPDAVRLTCEEQCVANEFSNQTCPFCDPYNFSRQEIVKVVITLFILLAL